MIDGIRLTLLIALLAGCTAGAAPDQRADALRRRIALDQQRATFSCDAGTLGCRGAAVGPGQGSGR